MAFPKKIQEPETAEVCFFVYNVFDHTLCNRFTYEMPMDKKDYVRDPQTNQMVPDAYARKTIDFISGLYRTSDPKIIQELDNYEANQRKSGAAPAVLISREVIHPKGTIVQNVVSDKIVEKPYIPLKLVERLDLQSIIEMADSEFNHTITSPTKEEAVEELKEAGLIK